MNKEKHLFLFVLFMILVCMLFSGCSDNTLLEEIPKDMVFYQSSHAELAESLQPGFVREEDSANSKENGQENVSGEEAQEHKENAPIFLMEEAGDFAYRTLDETEKIWYCDIERILGSFETDRKLSTSGLDGGLEASDIDRIFQCVLNDHPELFFVEGYSYTKYTVENEVISIEFSGTYTMDLETALERKAEIEEQAEQILKGIDAAASEYEKVKYVYETIIQNTDYKLDAPDNQNIYSVFMHHYSVCQGYAKAVQYLLNKLGIECTLVLGSVETGQGHAWNLVRIDGEYYYLDTTWGDASYRSDGEEAASGLQTDTISYDYLNVTTEEILRTHTINAVVPMPECNAREANYYVREGGYFDSYDSERIAQLFEEAFAAGKSCVTIKCSDEDCYAQISTALIENREIFKYLQGMENKVVFSQNDKQLSLTFWVTNE